jgi:hypothetical protein
MGNTSYCCDTRALRATCLDYASGDVDKIFVQQSQRKAHESMLSCGVKFRECRDSEAHPKSVPIIIGLDVTGSMGDIPKNMIADGLPTMMSTMIQNGVEDAAVLFLAVGDHECDRFPLQISQFESGDEELDMWLTRTYLEGGGGGNAGESYPLAWDFAANRVSADHIEKRGKKGFVFTIGDEPFLNSFPASAMAEIYGEAQASRLTAAEMYKAACEKFHVFHISIEHGYRRANEAWNRLLGQNHIILRDHTEVPKTIANIVMNFSECVDEQQSIVNPSDQLVRQNDEPATDKIPSLL